MLKINMKQSIKFQSNKQEKTALKYFHDSKSLSEYSNDMVGIYKIIQEYNPNKKFKLLTIFGGMIGACLVTKY